MARRPGVAVRPTLSSASRRMIFAEDVRVADASRELTSRLSALRRLLRGDGPDSSGGAAGSGMRSRRTAMGRCAWCTHAMASGLAGVHAYLLAGDVRRASRNLSRMAGGTPLDDDTATRASSRSGRSGVPHATWARRRFRSKPGSTHAISHTKGCYVGQEIIVRIRDRAHGRVARKLVGLLD